MPADQLPARAPAPPTIRDPQQTSYTPIPVAGLTPDDRVEAATRHVSCDGGADPALGHPRIWMKIEDLEVTCPYCSRTFVLAHGAAEEHGH
jgi:uncharacterized Zn-finger protein